MLRLLNPGIFEKWKESGFRLQQSYRPINSLFGWFKKENNAPNMALVLIFRTFFTGAIPLTAIAVIQAYQPVN